MTTKLHKHALSNSKRGIAVDENGKLDDEVSVISSEVNWFQTRIFTFLHTYMDFLASKKTVQRPILWHQETC